MAENKQKLEKEEAERLEAHKNKRSFDLGREKIIEAPAQSPSPNLPEYIPQQMIYPDYSKESPYISPPAH
jgi:hypothetical protein